MLQTIVDERASIIQLVGGRDGARMSRGLGRTAGGDRAEAGPSESLPKIGLARCCYPHDAPFN